MELQDQRQERDDLDLQTQAQRLEELELSETWRQLLGLEGRSGQQEKAEEPAPTEPVMIEPLPNDPWSELVQTRGTEVIDLQRLHASHEPLSEQDVEQALQAIQEQPIQSTQNQAQARGTDGQPMGEEKS
ncbi:MAG: hypothetical protein IRZ31_06005 [Thermogemmatispora sp.]|uniref:hypothetical protein n=1 Tax=Thermogemmatispora sp. TaxID=1968838 RepID=UPI00262C4907|nr:hypothetical protein [Thermogemmatispora sp.]MBX5456437.1 hypothetical protein [Thermogemmatispora sp.]